MKLKYLVSLVVALVLIVGWVFVASYPTSASQRLEKFLVTNKASDEIAQAYRFALEDPQGVLSKVKCYCGCLARGQHQNNKECFFKPNGEIDLMGLNCGLCIKTALFSKQMLAEGKTVQEISDFVDAKWGRL